MNLKKTLLVGSFIFAGYMYFRYMRRLHIPKVRLSSSKKVSVSVVLSSTKKKTLYRV